MHDKSATLQKCFIRIKQLPHIPVVSVQRSMLLIQNTSSYNFHILRNSSNSLKLNATNPLQLTLLIERYIKTLKVGIKLCIISPKVKKYTIEKKKNCVILKNLMKLSVPG